jgi:hypothetical protein
MVLVTKADGSKEAFSEEKLRLSIKRAGIPQQLQEQVLHEIEKKAHDGMATFEIYQMIIDALSRSEQPYSRARYSLKQAIMLLGPTGYPFEDFIAKLLQEQGYRTKTRQILLGKCVSHEIDVVAEKEGKRAMIEAKFHNSPGTRSEIHVALYVKARFDDIKDKHDLHEAWIVTNTKTTIDANAYADCVGMKVLSWNYPEGAGLRDMVEQANLHPITMLTTLTATQKLKLLENHIVLCKDLLRQRQVLAILDLSNEQREDVLNELTYICEDHGADREL